MQPMKPNVMTKEVTFFNGDVIRMPRNWQATLTGEYPGKENIIVVKKFPSKTKLHPDPLTEDEKIKSLQDEFQVTVPTVTARYYTGSDGQACYTIVDSIVGSYPRRAHDYGDTIFKTVDDIRERDIKGAVKCAVHAMDFFTKKSPKTFDKKIVLDQTEKRLKACLVVENSAARFKMHFPEQWKDDARGSRVA